MSGRKELDLSLPSLVNFAGRLGRTVSELIQNDAPELNIAPSARQLVYRSGPTRLYYYGDRPAGERAKRPMVLLVPSLINRPFIFDLIPERSFTGYLTGRDIDVYLLDWGIPRAEDAYITFDDYITVYFREAVAKLRQFSGRSQVNILGYCIGGLLSMLYSAMYPEEVSALINLASPVDFSEAGIMRGWVDKSGVDLERLVAAHGNVAPAFLFLVFAMLKPTSKASAFRIFFERRDDENFNRFHRAMDHWANYNIPFPGAFAKRYIREFYRENRLLKGNLSVAGHRLTLADYTGRFLNITAASDHIVPKFAAKKAEDLIGSGSIASWEFNTGHVGLLVGSKAQQNMWPRLADWLLAGNSIT